MVNKPVSARHHLASLALAVLATFSTSIHAQATIAAGDTTYRGSFTTDAKTGAVSGTGTVQWKSGNRYEGPVVNTQLTGKGSFTWANGDTYVGDMVNAQPHGQGTYTFKSGDRYTGAWRNGQKHGMGTYTFANGSVWEGEFANDQQFKQGVVAVAAAPEATKPTPAPVPAQAATVAPNATATPNAMQTPVADTPWVGKGWEVRRATDNVWRTPAWVFNADGTAEAKGLWKGTWEKLPNGRVQLKFITSDGKQVSPEVEFAPSGTEMTMRVDGKDYGVGRVASALASYRIDTSPAPSSANSVTANQAVRSRPPAFHNYCELRIDKTIYLGSCKDSKMHGRGLFVDVVKDRGIWNPVVYLRPVRHDMGVAYAGPRNATPQQEGVGALVDRANYRGMHAILDRPDLLDHIDPTKWSDFGNMEQVKVTREFQKKYANDDYDNLLPGLLKRMDELQLETYRSDWNLVTRKDEAYMFEEFRRRYSAYDPDNRVTSIPEHLRRIAYKRYRDDFDQAQGVESLQAFIHNYGDNDPDKLVPQARQRLTAAAKRREDAQREKAQAAADRAKRLCASLYVGKAVNLVGDVFGVSILSYRGVVTGFSVKQNSVSVRINDRSDMHDQMVEIGCERLRD